jgi:hypothetical protein
MNERLQIFWISPLRSATCAYFTHLAGRNRDGSRWELSAEDALLAVEQRLLSLYLIRNGRIEDIVVANYEGRSYLKTASDELIPTQLLRLPAFTPVCTSLLPRS